MASEIIVQTIKGPTSGANANKIIVPSGQTLDASAGFVPPAGAIVQTQYISDINNTGTQTNASTTFVALNGYTVSITPKYADSKLLITGKVQLYTNGGTSPWALITCYRDGVDISSSTYKNGYQQGDQYVGTINPFGYVVDANSTSQTTFQMYFAIGGGGASTLQADRADKFMCVQEIKQ